MLDNFLQIKLLIYIFSKLYPTLSIVEIRRDHLFVLENDFTELHKFVYLD